MEKVFITRVEKQKLLVKIKFISETEVEGEFLYPFDRIRFQYDSATISLNTSNNYNELKFLIHSVFQIYNFLIQSEEGLVKKYVNLNRWSSGKDVSAEKLPEQLEVANKLITRISEFTEEKYFNKFLKERITKSIISVLNDKKFDFKILNWSDYDWIFYKTAKDADFIMNIDTYETVKKTVFWLDNLRQSRKYSKVRFKIMKDRRLNSELPKEEIDKLEYLEYNTREDNRLPVLVDVHDYISREFNLDKFTKNWEDSTVAIIERESDESEELGMGIYWVMKGGKLKLLKYFPNKKTTENIY